MKAIIFLILIVSTFSIILPQSKDPDEILKKVAQEFEKIDDYEVNVEINVDIKFLKIPDRHAKIYFKKPDKIFVKSENFVLLPKRGLNFTPVSFLKDPYTAILDREEVINGIKTTVIKIIPIGGSSDIIISTLWIDELRSLILRVESSTKPDGMIAIDLKYSLIEVQYYLPSIMEFTFNVDRINLPSTVTGDMRLNNSNEKNDKNKQGKVIIKYSDYKVNIGLSDEIFNVREEE
jgi:hypothetical protein